MKLLNLIVQTIRLKYIGLRDNKLIYYHTIRKILNNKTKNNQILDKKYTLLSREDMEKILNINFLQNLQYRKEVFDCDDFAFNFMWFIRNLFGNIAVGVAFIEYKNGARHALNFMMTESNNILFIEPQTSKFKRIRNSKIYFMIV